MYLEMDNQSEALHHFGYSIVQNPNNQDVDPS